MRSCEEILELISAALDDELTEGERRELEAHLDACPACSALWEELSGLRDASAEPEEAPVGFAGQVMAKIAAEPTQEQSVLPFPARKRSRIPWKGWTATAAVAAVVLLGVFALPGRLDAASDNPNVRSASGGAAPAGDSDFAGIAPESEPEDEMSEMDEIIFAPNPQAEEPTAGQGDSFWNPAESGAPEMALLDQAPEAENDLMGAANPAVYCGVLIMTGEPLPEGLEEFESEVEADGSVSYVVPASYFYSNSSKLLDEMASNYIDCSQESNTDPTAEYGLIIVEPQP